MSEQNDKPIQAPDDASGLTMAQLRAAQYLALGTLTDKQIGKRVGVTRWTIWSWGKLPAFAAKLAELKHEVASRVFSRGIARRDVRVRMLNQRHRKLLRVIEERGRSEAMAAVPGGRTGLLVKRTRIIGKGDDAQLVEEHEVDVGSLAEMRAIEQQVAKELGQANPDTVVNVTTNVDASSHAHYDLGKLDVTELESLRNTLSRATAEPLRN